MGIIYRGFNMNDYPALPADELASNIQAGISWGPNIFRWQLVTDVNAASGWNLQQYQSWLDSALDTVDSILPLFEAQGVSVVLDMHTPVYGVSGTQYTIFADPSTQPAFISIWQSIADRYKGDPTVIAYDLLNEPMTPHSAPWQALAQQTAEAIRALDTEKIIVMECIGSDPRNISGLHPLSGVDPVWYSIHDYLPQSISFQGIPDANCKMIAIGAPYPSATVNKAKMQTFMQPALDFQSKYGVPIYVGEFSCARWSGYPDYNNAFNFESDMLSLIGSYGWHWTYHAFREASAWNLEFSTTPCPNLCIPNCVEPYQDTDRKQLFIDAFKANQAP